MNDWEIKNSLKLLVAYNVGEVLSLLQKSINIYTDIGNELILLIARYNDLNRDVKINNLDRDITKVEINKIRWSIMHLIDNATESDLSLSNVSRLLFEEKMFKSIIEKKVTKHTFIGMLGGSGTFKLEHIVINWNNLFVSKDRTIQNINKLQSAINLIETKYNLSLTSLEQEDLSGIINKMEDFLDKVKYFIKSDSWDKSNKDFDVSINSNLKDIFKKTIISINILIL